MKTITAVLVVGLAPAPGFAGDAYDCGFEVMGVDGPARMTLNENETAWELVDDAGEVTRFVSMPGSNDRDAVHLISTNFDPDADAVAMLSVSTAGDARLSFHGFFPSLSGMTFAGTCHRKDP